VRGWGLDPRIDDRDVGAVQPSKHIGRRAAREEIAHHLASDLLRIEAHTFGGDAMVAGEDQKMGTGDLRLEGSQYHPDISCQVLEDAERGAGLGERVEAGLEMGSQISSLTTGFRGVGCHSWPGLQARGHFPLTGCTGEITPIKHFPGKVSERK